MPQRPFCADPLAISLASLFLLVIGTFPLSAQMGRIYGTVVDGAMGTPLEGARVEARGGLGGEVITDAQGEFTLTLAAGTYALVVAHPRFDLVRRDAVRVEAGGETVVSVSLMSRAFALNPMVVTASRRAQRVLDAPSAVTVLSGAEVRSRAALSVSEQLVTVPGMDVARTGLQQSNVVARGFNNVFSGALLVLADHRPASLPSLGFNAQNLISTSGLDLDRVEIVVGPGSALYGPNSTSGVLHLLTTSPLDDQGTRVSLTGGERSVFQAEFRHGLAVTPRVGLRVSGQYFRGEDWPHEDSVEVRAFRRNPDAPRVGARDPQMEGRGGEVRVDLRPWSNGEWVLTGGVRESVSSIELTGIGAAQAKNWRYSFLQTRLRRGGLFAQAYGNFSDAGDTYLLRTGDFLVDESQMLGGQLQQQLSLGSRFHLTAGGDLQLIEPRTGGTITGRNEEDDEILEAGAYLHGDFDLSPRLKLTAAARLDHHSRLEDPVFSPRGGVVFTPKENQAVRFTFNRAFGTPTPNNLFLDVLSSFVPIRPGLGYDVRARGVPETGFTFQDRCSGGLGGLCMRSPFAGGQLPAQAALAWDALIQSLVPELAAFLPKPGSQVSTVFRRLDLNAVQSGIDEMFPLDEVGPVALERLRPTIHNTLEVGYRGLLGDRVHLRVDAYRSRIQDFVGPLRIETPHVFFEPGSLAAYVTERLTPLVAAGVIEAEVMQTVIGELARVPIGVVTPDQLRSPEVLLSYRNFGDVDLWGVDVGVEVSLSPRMGVFASGSLVNRDCFGEGEECLRPQDVALNSPARKGSLRLRFQDPGRGVTLEAQGRFQDPFPMNSGVFVGEVEGGVMLDAQVGYQLGVIPGVGVTLSGTNLTNATRRGFMGAPALGRLILLRLAYGL